MTPTTRRRILLVSLVLATLPAACGVTQFQREADQMQMLVEAYHDLNSDDMNRRIAEARK